MVNRKNDEDRSYTLREVIALRDATISELKAALNKIAVEGFACNRRDCEDYEDWAERDQDFRRNIAKAALKENH